MKITFERGALSVDLLTTPDDVTRVVHLALAAGLIDIQIGRSDEEEQWAEVKIALPDGGWANSTSVAVLKLVSALSGTPVERLIENWERDKGLAFAAAEGQHSGS